MYSDVALKVVSAFSFSTAVVLLFIAIFPLLLSLYALVRASLSFSYPLCSHKVGISSFRPTEYFATMNIIARNEAHCPAALRTNFGMIFGFPQCNFYWKYKNHYSVPHQDYLIYIAFSSSSIFIPLSKSPEYYVRLQSDFITLTYSAIFGIIVSDFMM